MPKRAYASLEDMRETIEAVGGDLVVAARAMGYSSKESLQQALYARGVNEHGEREWLTHIEPEFTGDWQEIDWSDAPIAKMFGTKGTNFYGLRLLRKKPL